MSQNDKHDDKKFLSRWLQRKLDAKEPVSKTQGGDAAKISTDLPGPVAEVTSEEDFDLSTLPKLKEIVEGTDITAFLKKGVPESVRNAALRKSWALDPAIRNYVNPALDYAYDWNTPGGVPGSSELAAGMDIAKMVLQIMDNGESAGTPASSDMPNAPHQIDSSVPGSLGTGADSAKNSGMDLPTEGVRPSDATISATEKPADSTDASHLRGENSEEPKSQNVGAPQHTVRRHGTAKPTL